MSLYRPANGTEGALFFEEWCCQCQRDINEDCDILARSLAFDIGDPQYPREWVRVRVIADDGLHINMGKCTAFVPLGAAIPAPRCTRTGELFP